MKNKYHSIRLGLVTLLIPLLCIGAFIPNAMAPGLNNAEAIGKFLNGNLPATTPSDSGGSPTAPALLSQTGAFADLSNLTPATGVIPYDMIEPFWSDGAAKSRWLAIPNDGSHDTAEEQIQFSADDDWVFPRGAVLIKHFELGGQRLETRFEVKGDDDVYYYLTYKWNAAQTDADLLTGALDEEIMVNGMTQTWHYPSRAECLSCHLPEVSSVLGLKTRHLNKAITYPQTGLLANQLVSLSNIGILDETITDANVGNYMAVAAKDDMGASLEYRARSYIDVNCSNCHQPVVNNVAMFDARITTPLENQNIIYGPVVYDEGLTDPNVVIPQEVGRSMMHFRMNSTATGIEMPPLAKDVADAAGVQLIADWINSLTPSSSFPPEANISASPVYGLAPLVVSFDASGSSDPDGDNLTFDWDFGDNSTGQGEMVDHTYLNPGSYEVTLTVDDGQSTDQATATITVNNSDPGSNTVSFTDATSQLPGDHFSGLAMAVSDMNADGKDDIVRYNQGDILSILYQTSAGQAFDSYSFGQVSLKNQWSTCIADFDQNGYNDILCGGAYDDVRVIANNDGDESYTQQTLPSSNIFIQGSNFVDIDNDGWVDIFACHDDAESRAYLNNQDGTFSFDPNLISTETTPSSDNSGNYASMWTDYDNDGDLDLYISKCRGGVTDPADPRRINMLWQNDGSNNFTEVADQAGLKFGAQTWFSDFGDVDNDGDLDCLVINHFEDPIMMRNNGDGTFTDVTSSSGLVPTLDEANYYGIQGYFRDFNNDGYLDLLVSGDNHYIFYNNGDGTFMNAANPFNSNGIQSFVVGDLNHDGFLDLYAGYANDLNSPSSVKDRLWLNNGNSNNFIAIQLEGTFSNINGIGARVELHGPWGLQIREVRSGEGYGVMNSLTQHFGIGTSTQITKVVVQWPSGLTDEIFNPAINQFLHIVEGGKADFTYARQEPFDIPAAVDFDASVSTFDVATHSFSWDFGDGGGGSGVYASHTYSATGTYTAVLTATHNVSGEQEQVSKDVVIIDGCASQVGQPCGDGCAADATVQPDCSCMGSTVADSDNDGVCDELDQCPGGDDNQDANNNGIPDCCDPDTHYDFNDYPVVSYDSGQDFGPSEIQDGGRTLYMDGNAWKAIQIDYPVSVNTVLSFDFKSTAQGEIHEISFDTDLGFGPDHRLVVYGDQGYQGTLPYNPYTGNGDWEHFQFNIGASFTGSYAYLVLTADDDADASGNSYFRDIRLIEDADGDGTPDDCDLCPDFDDSLLGTACDDGQDCTENDTWQADCTCAGTQTADSDNDGVCDAEDQCPDFDNSLIGTPCNDGDPCTTNDVWQSDCSCAGSPAVLISDSFESSYGNWIDGGSDATRIDNTAYANTGSYSVRLRDNSSTSLITTGNYDLSGYNMITVEFSYIVNSFEGSEEFWLQLSTDGGSNYNTMEEWNLGDEFQNNERHDETVVLSGPFSSETSFRFRANASGNGDEVYLDDIVISGCLPLPEFNLDIQVFMMGPYDGPSSLMSDGARQAASLPMEDPFNNNDDVTDSSVFDNNGQDSVVDWLELEFFDTAFNLITKRSALLQRDGDIVDIDGTSLPSIEISPGSYHICVRHRNHCAIMSKDPILLQE